MPQLVYSTNGTFDLVIEDYGTLTVDVKGASGGGGSTPTGANFVDGYPGSAGTQSSFSSATPLLANGGSGGGAMITQPSTVSGSNGADGTASGGSTNTTGGGPNGGIGASGYPGYSAGNGGKGGRAQRTWTVSDSGAPVIGSHKTIIVGAKGTGGPAPPYGVAGGDGANGSVTITWTVAFHLTANNIVNASPTIGSPVGGQRTNSITNSSPSIGSPSLGQIHAITINNLINSSPSISLPVMSVGTYLDVHLDSPIVPTHYSISSIVPDDSPKHWSFFGSNDQITWTLLDERIDHPIWEDQNVQSFPLLTRLAYSHFRFWFIESQSGVLPTIGRLQIYTPAAVASEFRWEIGPPEMRYYWAIHVDKVRLSWFRASSGQAGVDPHLRISIASDLECLFRRWKPAHTQIVFDYSKLEQPGPMSGTP